MGFILYYIYCNRKKHKLKGVLNKINYKFSSIDVSIESINNNFNHSDISEKEYLHVYEGIGEVWILPTLSCYEDFSEDINEKQEQ